MSRLLLIALLTVACNKAHRQSARYEGRYRLESPGPGWDRVQPGGADRAWFNADTSASIYFDSNCLARYEDGRLPDLLTHLTFGIAEGEPLREETLMLDGREALLRMHAGHIDGVQVHIGAVVTKKNECLYDGLYIAPPARFDDGWNSFVQVLSGFESRRP